MQETFNYSPRIEPTGSTAFRTSTAKFGDGYQQRVDRGINVAEQSWPLEFVGEEAKIQPIKAFFDRHRGSKSFLWTPPMSEEGHFVLQDGYQITPMGRRVYRLTATFIQVFGA